MYLASAVESATLFRFLEDQGTLIFPIVDTCPMCFFFQLCIPHNRSPNIQSTHCDITIQHFVYPSNTSIFSL
jgi:hypothetical protein